VHRTTLCSLVIIIPTVRYVHVRESGVCIGGAQSYLTRYISKFPALLRMVSRGASSHCLPTCLRQCSVVIVMRKNPRSHSLTRERFQQPLVVNGIRCCLLDFGSNQTCPIPQQTNSSRSHFPAFSLLTTGGRCVFTIAPIVYPFATAIARSYKTVNQDRCANCIRMLREDFRIPRTLWNSHLYHH